MRGVSRARCMLAASLVALAACAGRTGTARVEEGLEDVVLRTVDGGEDALAAAEGSLAAAREDLARARSAAERVAASVSALRADRAQPAARLERARQGLVDARGDQGPAPLAAARTELRAAEADLGRAERELEYGDAVVALANRRVALREVRVELAEARLASARAQAAATPAEPVGPGREGNEGRVQALTRSLVTLEAEVRAARRKLEVWHAHLVETGEGAPPDPERWLAPPQQVGP